MKAGPDEPCAPVAGLRGTVVADGGVPVAWERWPHSDGPSLVLVHGTSAHTAWWHHTVPWLTDRYDVVAVDLSGHGESGRRPSYSLEGWSEEVAQVVGEVCGGSAVLVGHSIGGLVTAGTAATRPDMVEALVLVDSLVADPIGAARQRPVMRVGVVYPTADEALARYRLMPPQPVADDRTLSYVAERSLREVEGGWTWKVDPAIFGALDAPSLVDRLSGITCPTAVVRGALSQLVEEDAGAKLSALIGRTVPQYDVPDAYHHVMIDKGPSFGRLLCRALDALESVTSPERT